MIVSLLPISLVLAVLDENKELLAVVYNTEEYTAFILECIETDKPESITTSHKVKEDDMSILL